MQAANDLLIAPNAAAPYTGSWQPAFNSPSWATIGDPGVFPDPVGQLSRYNGTSSAGTWTLLVADSSAADTGTLTSWSLIVTPRAFACTAFVDPPPVTTITPTPAAPNGLAGWYVTAADARPSRPRTTSAAIVQETRCALDPGAAPATFGDLPAGCGFASPARRSRPTACTRSTPRASMRRANAGTPIAAAFKIDTTPPTLTCALPAPTFTLNQAGGQVLANVTDAASGPAAPQASAPPDTTSRRQQVRADLGRGRRRQLRLRLVRLHGLVAARP